MRKLSIVVLAGALLLAACGGKDSITSVGTTGTGTGTGTGSGSSTTIAAVAGVTAQASVPSILSDNSTSATITAFVVDASNNLIGGIPVTFSPSSGAIAPLGTATDDTGTQTATLSTPGNSTPRTITVTIKAGGKTATVDVQVVAGSTASTSVQMGSPAAPGKTFTAGAIGISSTTLSAGGSATLSVALQNADGSLYTQSAAVSFSSTCAGTGLAKIASPVTTTTGVATTTYVASGCSGNDPITATATVGTTPLSATGNVTVAAASVGSIVYKSASFTVISLKGSGTTAHPETSTVLFQILDSSGSPVANKQVVFSLNTTVGGISVDPGPVTSDANGNVQTTVQAGTVATPVRVTATVQSTTPVISTQSNQLSVSTGVPTQNAFSLAVKCPNVEAWNVDGVTVAVTARLADRFSNPVADGTAVQFNSEGGHIQPQCTTASTATESGVCSVNWVSANPRPTIGKGGRAGRSMLFATAIGEESFVDANGNGAFDPGETFTDLAERFRDDDESGTYTSGEYFYDFNNNGARDPADGIFNGVLCNDPARCDSTKTSTGIAASNLIIMSAGTPDNTTPPAGTVLTGVAAAGGTQTYVFTFKDLNNNPLPAGTTIAGTMAGTGLAIASGSPSSFTVPCTTEPVSYAFTVTATAGTAVAGSSGTLTLDVKSPGGLESFLTYSVPVN
jgi:hypothetical protein